MNLQATFTYPYDNELLLRKQKSIKRELLEREDITYTPVRIAMLGGSTTDDIRNILELFLLAAGIQPVFYQSEYNKFYEDAVFGNEELDAFQPEIVVVFTSVVNIVNWPDIADGVVAVQEKLAAEYGRLAEVWEAIKRRYHAVIIQNNYESPCVGGMGSLDAVAETGRGSFVAALNGKMVEYARLHEGFYIHDLNGLAARTGLHKWYNPTQFCAYKFAMDYDVMPDVSLGMMVQKILKLAMRLRLLKHILLFKSMYFA